MWFVTLGLNLVATPATILLAFYAIGSFAQDCQENSRLTPVQQQNTINTFTIFVTVVAIFILGAIWS